MIETIKWFLAMVVITGITWGMGKMVADSVSDYEIITPAPDVKCVVVSRMFNTSVACWEGE